MALLALSSEKIKWNSIKWKKKSFDQTPNLTETFDQVKRSSEIWSSECFPDFSLIVNSDYQVIAR